MKHLSELDRAVMDSLLEGDDVRLQILREQLRAATVAKKEMTGVGFFLYFLVPDNSPRLENLPELIVSNSMQVEVNELKNGAGFVLWVTNGVINQLEGYCFGEEWPENISGFKILKAGATTLSERTKKS